MDPDPVAVLFAILFLVVLALLTISATFGGNGDVSRWAAVSTIWLVLPVIVLALIALAALCGGVYLLTRLTACCRRTPAARSGFSTGSKAARGVWPR